MSLTFMDKYVIRKSEYNLSISRMSMTFMDKYVIRKNEM
jgi:hypothetical protein